MKLSKVIKKLQDVMASCGDMEVLAADDVTPDNVFDVTDEREAVKAVVDVVTLPCGEGAAVLSLMSYDEAEAQGKIYPDV